MISCIIYIFLQVCLTGAAESDIVGGKEAKPHSRPYMVSIQFQGQHVCGGILIQKDFVLTAAHCKNDPCTVVLGAHDISEAENSQQHIEVAKYYPHPEFNGEFEDDIMLLKLKKKATLKRKIVETIGLPKKNEKTPANMECAVAGWGRTTANGSISNVLKEATENIESTPKCKEIWQQYFNSDNMICTNFTKKSGGVCQGDSGGPLVCKKKLKGITAYTLETDCNDPAYPHVFTNVSFFLPWIKKTMKK
ncbi:granzyme B-like [Archocentrus centrarchus]|uniref:granzyme B-like n=1 Tax=Archocentrus centrarchus TaxID=63155 RepID=UPI0011EA531B|nr:granzyme B-like [Archocentrus centrarchus]